MEAIHIIWRRKWVILATVLVALAVAFFGSRMIEPTYQATTTIRVSAGGGSISYVAPQTQYSDRIMGTFANIATSSIILDQLRDEANFDTMPVIDIEPVADTELMLITVEHHDPVIAANTANALANLLIEYSQTNYSNNWSAATEILEDRITEAKADLDQAQAEYDALVRDDPLTAEQVAELERLQETLEQTTFDRLFSMEQENYRGQINRASAILAIRSEIYTRLVEQYTQSLATDALRGASLTMIEPASIPDTPTKPNVAQNLLLGGVLGLLGGLGLGFLFERLDTTLHSVRRIEALFSLPILGSVPLARRSGLLGFLDVDAKFLHPEAFRRLRSNLLSVMREESLRTILFTSALPGEGKSTIVANLATSLAEARKRILIIDSDLHRPTMHLTFGLANKVGLTNVLKGEVDVDEAIQPTVTPSLFVLTSGPPTPEPNALLSTVLMSRMLDEAIYKYDVVLLDSPAFLAVADTTSLASLASGVIIVAAQGMAKEETVLALRQEFSKIGAHPIGVVANRVTPDLVSQYSRHYMTVAASDEEEHIVVPPGETTPETEAKLAPPSTEQPAPPAVPQPATAEKHKVLIIEDQPEIRFLMEKSLTQNYDVKAAQDGPSGIEISEEWEPDAVLLDIMMPKISGIDVCRQLRANKQTANIPIIMVTARSTIEDKREGFYAGADDYLVKPFTMEELALRLEALLKRGRNNHHKELPENGA